jgi:endoglucanase
MRHESNRSVRIREFLLGLTGLLVVLLIAPSASWASDRSAYVRVNQLGYESGLPMRAYFMATGSQSGAKFTVKNSDGQTSYSAFVGSKIGTWGDYTVYSLDFILSAAGNYTISVTGPIPASSPAFRVDTPAQLYSAALSNALSFYQNQRDGADYVSSPLRRAPAHLNDQKAKVYYTPEFGGREGSRIKGDLNPTGMLIDASGGWWDAGDYLKFVETSSYVVALMLIGVRDFPNQMGPGSPTADFTNESRFGLDWLQRMWDDNSKTLYYQVGIGSWNWHYENDHSIWRLAQEDDKSHGNESKFRYIRNRPVFVAAPAESRISPNLAGRLAGDFALCSMVYRATDKSYADRCLLAAEHVFDLADTSIRGELLTTAPHDFYGESEWRDDMEFGAAELYFATRGPGLPEGLPHADPIFYLQAAANWASAYIQSTNPSKDTLNLYDITGLADFELWRAMTISGDSSHLAVSQADIVRDMRKKLDGAVAQANQDPFGFGFSWGHDDSATHGAGLSVMASEYDHLTKSSTYATFSRQWLGNVLGANAWGSSFIVGDGSIFPHCPHHQVANLVGSHDGQSPILAGAMVSGPNGKGDSGAPGSVMVCPSNGDDLFSKFNGNGSMYKDNVKFYSTVEPAIDYTAASLLMFAWRAAGAPSDVVLEVSGEHR